MSKRPWRWQGGNLIFNAEIPSGNDEIYKLVDAMRKVLTELRALVERWRMQARDAEIKWAAGGGGWLSGRGASLIQAADELAAALGGENHAVQWNGVFRGSTEDPREVGWCAACGRDVYDGDDERHRR